jgi:hypothetical protein
MVNQVYGESRNLLPARTPIPFVPFARVHPGTGRALNPNAQMTLPNGRRVTVQRFEALNQAEQRLTQRGYSLRRRDTFAGVRLNRAQQGGRPPPISSTGRVTTTTIAGRPVMTPGRPEAVVAVPTATINRTGAVVVPAATVNRPGTVVVPAATVNRPGAVAAVPAATINRPAAVVGVPTAAMNLPGAFDRPPTGGVDRVAVSAAASMLDTREAALIRRITGTGPAWGGAFGEPSPPPSASTTLRGTNDGIRGERISFAIWMTTIDVTSTGGSGFEYMSGASTQAGVWQVSSEPFPEQAPASYTNWQSPPGLLRSGVLPACTQPCHFELVMADIVGGPPPAEAKYYFVRVLPVWAWNPATLLGMPSNQVVVRYGVAVPGPPVVLSTYDASTSGAHRLFEWPAGQGRDFQVWLDTQGFDFRSGKLNGVPVGISGDAHVMLRGRTFNPASLVDAGQPRTIEYTLAGVEFAVAAGVDVSSQSAFNQGDGIAPRARITLHAPGGTTLNLVDEVGTESSNLNFECGTVGGGFNPESHVVLWFGPVPVDMRIGARIDYGVTCMGKIVSDPNEVRLFAQPFVTANVYASAGTDLVIAWAKLESQVILAEERIFVEMDTGSPNDIFAGRHELSNVLEGRMYFTVGFYHPCPPVEQVEKLWGYITGDDEVPLCSTSFEETLLNTPEGYSNSARLF